MIITVQNWLRVYTDGSATGVGTNAGAGIYLGVKSQQGRRFTNFDGGVAAVHTTLTEIANREQNTVLFNDSQATIRAISFAMPSKKKFCSANF
ncbi:hypothetical protein CEXT_681281 [Caerostris extrusa]|uniref:RNase H type-1 domain-containing protein n=1 Tax=Caerostris extrusa TaxID=172846 RepID=A0AAV4RE69_CAEEX|nr:hypothetical protein CEXT_681281 [Caerostris extrusa]